MATIPIKYFGSGMSDDYAYGGQGEFSVSKHFDILSYPRRLQPLRSMTTESTTDSAIGNLIVGSNGRMYGVGVDPSNPTNGKLWVRSDNATTSSGSSYGASSTWRSLTSDQLSGVVLRNASYSDSDYPFLVDYPDFGNVRTMLWASTNVLVASDPLGASSATTTALSFSTISQGFVHPKDKRLYFGYQTGSSTYIGRISSNATAFSSVNFTALQLPNNHRVYSITDYGNYLAIGCTTPNGLSSVVFLWDRDETLTTLSETINWGAGQLKVLNNLKGALVGVNTMSANTTGTVQDMDGIEVKLYLGGAEPTTVKQIKAQRLTTTAPSCVLLERVNFIRNDRLYFSANVVNGGTAPAYYGLWSFGKNRNDSYALTIERMATNTGTETGVFAAAMSGDFVAMAHTANGTLTATTNGNTLSSIYDATSVYESNINPEMPTLDTEKKKKLMSVYCTYLPLPTDATVVMQYRVDVSANASGSTLGNGWTTIFTETGNGVVFTERVKDAAGSSFTDGRKYEFRITSTDGAIITGWGYRYKVEETNI